MIKTLLKIYEIANLHLSVILGAVALMILQACFDLLGLGLLVAFISNLWLHTDSVLIEAITEILAYLNVVNTPLGLTIGIIFFFLLRFIAFSITNFYILHWSAAVGAEQRMNILNSLNHSEYSLIKDIKLAGLQRNVFELSNGFVGKGISSAFKLLADTTLILGITLTVTILVNEYFLIAIFGLITLIYLVDSSLKKLQKISGENNAIATKEILDALRDFYVSTKFARICNKSVFFVSRMQSPSLSYALNWRNSVFLSAFPRFLIELIVIVFCLLYVFFITNDASVQLQSQFLIIVLFLRVLPIGNSIATSLSQLRNCSFLIAEIEACLQNFSDGEDYKKQSQINKIEIKNITKTVGKKNLFENLSLSIYQGSIVGIVGQTGSGKSTLVDVLCGLIKPNCGEINYFNKTGHRVDKPYINYVDQDTFLFRGTLAENIECSPDAKLTHDSLEMLHKFNLDDFLDKEHSTFDLSRISGGEKQRINLLRAFAVGSNVHVLDEPTSALDVHTSKIVYEELKRLASEGAIIFIITHDQSLVSYFDQIITLNKGGAVV